MTLIMSDMKSSYGNNNQANYNTLNAHRRMFMKNVFHTKFVRRKECEVIDYLTDNSSLNDMTKC